MLDMAKDQGTPAPMAVLPPVVSQKRRRASLEADDPNSEAVAGLAVPRRHHVLSTVAEQFGAPLRNAVGILSASLQKKGCGSTYSNLLASQGWQPDIPCTRNASELAGWALVAIWTVAVAAKALPAKASLTDAEDWFFGPKVQERLTGLLPVSALGRAHAALQTEESPANYRELLPYVLDPHGPGSRLSVRRNPSTKKAQTRKRSEGVFYTPADVADYMASSCLEASTWDGLPSVFDPACGTGVFLRAALKVLKQQNPKQSPFALATECLFGTDIDPWAADATAFVLLSDTLAYIPQGLSPAEAWHRLRLNLACVDTLLIDPPKSGSEPAAQDSTRIALTQLFPRLTGGANVFLGNPPYADLGRRPDISELSKALQIIASKSGPGAEVYLAFLEQMTRLGKRDNCTGSLVLPLSIACNVGPQFSAARQLIGMTPGEWRFAFFDREPHALFGEDVKTRNAIIHWSRRSCDLGSRIATGPLRKWRGHNRAAMFKGLGFTTIDQDIRGGIPKVEGNLQATALSELTARWGLLETAVCSIERAILKSAHKADARTVFVGPTAYNFLNVFLAPPAQLLRGLGDLSEHPLHMIRCACREDAMVVFSILSSHLAYWWWHAHGDGFHVSARFLAKLPFGPDLLTGPNRAKLLAAGSQLWLAICSRPIVSVNRGRTSIAFTPNGHDDIRSEIDAILAEHSGLDEQFVQELKQFTARSISATLHGSARSEPLKEKV